MSAIVKAELVKEFTVHQLKKLVFSDVTILSVHKDRLLVGSQVSGELYVHSASTCEQQQVVPLPATASRLYDASWTAQGGIAYSTTDTRQAVLLYGNSTTQVQMGSPHGLSLSQDDLYLTDRVKGILHSTDGRVWEHVFKAPNEWQIVQAVKVVTEKTVDYWTVVTNVGDDDQRLHIYRLDRQDPTRPATSQEVALRTPAGTDLVLSWRTRLAYDGKGSVLMSDFRHHAVHAFSASSGEYRGQLLGFPNVESPWALAVDAHTQRLYVGQLWGGVKVFQLTY